jgi:hypothetical protein
LGIYRHVVGVINPVIITAMKFTDVRDKSRLAKSDVKYVVLEAQGVDESNQGFMYLVEKRASDGTPIGRGTLKAWDIPPAELEIADEEGTLDESKYKISANGMWIIDLERANRVKSFTGIQPIKEQ